MLGSRILLATLALALSACGNTQSIDTPMPSLTGCYEAKSGPDSAYLNLKADNATVRGILEYAFTQKDSSWGLVSGSSQSDTLNLDYQYLSEGVLSTRTLTLKREGEKLAGEGWAFQRTDKCGIGQGWQASMTTEVRTDTFHDPETGYYARAFFKIAGPLNGYSYRCIATVTDKSQKIVAEWVGAGVTDVSNAARTQNMQTNIRPEQVSEISDGSVICQTRTS